MKRMLAFGLVFAMMCNFAGCCISHNLFEAERIDASCEDTGCVKYKCIDCDYEETEIILPSGHNFSEDIAQEASCTAVGLKKMVCSTCGITEEIEIGMLDHNYEYSVSKEPSLDDYGMEIGVCCVCGDIQERQTMYLGTTRSNPGVVTIDKLVSDIKSDIDSAKEKYNGKWVKITGEVTEVVDGGIMTGYYLYGKRGDSGIRIVCWRDGDIYSGSVVGNTFTFIGQVREITTFNATEIGDCEIIAD